MSKVDDEQKEVQTIEIRAFRGIHLDGTYRNPTLG
jgi:hypothetical protein